MPSADLEVLHGKINTVAKSHSELRYRFDELEQQVNSHEKMLTDMATTQKMIGELLAIFISVKGGLQFLGWLAIGMKWLVTVGGFITSVWILWKTGQWVAT